MDFWVLVFRLLGHVLLLLYSWMNEKTIRWIVYTFLFLLSNSSFSLFHFFFASVVVLLPFPVPWIITTTKTDFVIFSAYFIHCWLLADVFSMYCNFCHHSCMFMYQVPIYILYSFYVPLFSFQKPIVERVY